MEKKGKRRASTVRLSRPLNYRLRKRAVNLFSRDGCQCVYCYHMIDPPVRIDRLVVEGISLHVVINYFLSRACSRKRGGTKKRNRWEGDTKTLNKMQKVTWLKAIEQQKSVTNDVPFVIRQVRNEGGLGRRRKKEGQFPILSLLSFHRISIFSFLHLS